jgi:hypothetical protein
MKKISVLIAVLFLILAVAVVGCASDGIDKPDIDMPLADVTDGAAAVDDASGIAAAPIESAAVSGGVFNDADDTGDVREESIDNTQTETQAEAESETEAEIKTETTAETAAAEAPAEISTDADDVIPLANIGDIIRFGKYDWRVLDVQDGKMLLIAEKVIMRRDYNDRKFESVTWADCELRQYLNGEFYDSFDEKDRARIIQVTNINPDNPWYGTDGGEDTVDYIFPLSIEEVVKYFGDSGKLRDRPIGDPNMSWLDGVEVWFINDEYNDDRKAPYADGVESYGEAFGAWWLRTPGGENGGLPVGTACVGYLGGIEVAGNFTGDAIASIDGVRPCLWVDISIFY